jgi:magnesium transporter
VLSGDVTDERAGEVLGAIARQEDLNGRIRRNVMDTRRAVSFMMRSKMLNAEQFEEARQILRDIESLDSHTAFLFDKINFLMDATVGFININQNKIIKIFSVASVALLPPTLIASIYGMNFKFMPELDWTLGYPYVLVLMLASALVPMWYFRRRGWLK